MSLMRDETLEAPQAVARCLANAAGIARIAARIRALDPPFVTVAARGSSSHAGTFLRVLLGRDLGLTAAAAMPSLASVYHRPQRLKGSLHIAISQSGRSPDLIATTEQARAAGALRLAFVNNPESPLAALSDEVIDIAAGPERSVAATKTVLATLAATLALVRAWSDNPRPLDDLAPRLAKSAVLDWSALANTLTATQHIFTIGRGPALGIAKEAALKLAETCGIAGLAYSAAELAHGPMALAGQGFPILAFLQNDAALPHSETLLTTLASRPTSVLAAGGHIPGAIVLPTLAPVDPDEDLLCQLLPFYLAAEAASHARGLDPDHPRSLQIVTQTI